MDSKKVLQEYGESDRYWDDSLAVVYSSPLRCALFNATEQYTKYFPKSSDSIIEHSIEHTIIKAQAIINEIVTNAVIIFDEWGDEPQPDTIFEAYRDSDAIWDAYEWFLDYSPINWLRDWILGWVGTTFPTTRIGEWASLLQADHYLVGLDNLIKQILENALDAYADSMEPADRHEHDYWH